MHIEETIRLNTVVSFVVTLAAVLAFVFVCNQKDYPRFVLKAGFLWLASWLVWIATWMVIGSQALQSWPHVVSAELLCSDVNSLILFLLYFTLTRAESRAHSGYRVMAIAIPIALGYVIMYAIFDSDLARSLHQRWSLVLAAAAPLMVGWAIAIRYRAYLPLIVGFAYGFVQPAAFEAVFPGTTYAPMQQALLAKAVVVLAVLKVVWALVIGRYLMARPAQQDPIVHIKAEAHELGFILQAPRIYFGYAAMLLGGLLVAYAFTQPISLAQFAALVGIIAGGLTVTKIVVTWWQEHRPVGGP